MALQTLYLIRHGKAVSLHPVGDRYRPLSDRGKADIQEILLRSETQDMRVELSLSSPYVRALQTASLFANLLQPRRNELSTALLPESDPQDAVDELAAWEKAGMSSAAIFSHNPFISDLAEALLIPGSVRSIVFQTTTIMALQFESGLKRRGGKLLWILHP